MHSHSPWRDKLRTVAEVTRRIIGAPDYERYLAHMRRHHSGERALTRAEFTKVRMDEKYSKPGSRCC